MSKPHRGGRSTVQSVTKRIEDVQPPKWRGVFKYRVGATLDQDPPRFTVTGWVGPKHEAMLKEGFGKTGVFTDRVYWDAAKIVRTYFARSSMEEELHLLKDALLMPVMPIFHRLDERIRVHAFLFVWGCCSIGGSSVGWRRRWTRGCRSRRWRPDWIGSRSWRWRVQDHGR